MKTPFTKIAFLALMLGVLTGCINENDLEPAPETPEGENETSPMSGLSVPDGFSFRTETYATLNLEVPQFLSHAVVDLYSKSGTEDSVAIGKAAFDANGRLGRRLALSQRADSLLIYSRYAGLTQQVRLPIEGLEVTFDYRPLYQQPGNMGKQAVTLQTAKTWDPFAGATYTYGDTYNSQGVPLNMAFPEPIAQSLLDDINASLPESVPGGIPVTHPEYLAGVETQVVLTKEADVWVTFVSEGAGYRNGLGYYTYPLGQAPQSPAQIAQHHIIFPNASMVGSNGGLRPGDRVFLGRFPANTVVSWFLVANGWTGNAVNPNSTVYYSDPNFNPETRADRKTHMVLLYDQGRNLTLLGFEDLNREGNSDNDFNDAVFYAKSNPVDAIQVGNLARIEAARDADGDGINDALDDFPFDPNKAFNNYAPANNATGTLAYEDLWPNTGDYDFNDLVLDYNFNQIANASNQLTSLEATFTITNIGASFANGFGFVLPIAPSLVANVSGQVLNGGYESLSANGTETGTRANETVILVAGNTLQMEGQTINLTVDFARPVDPGQLGDMPFNTFLIANGDRSREVHLPDFAPTSKAGMLGSEDDFSDPSNNRYYKTNRNLPWAINLYESFQAPPETVPITIQYPRFVNWANSGGTLSLDWYKR